jgi:hypothetical protein
MATQSRGHGTQPQNQGMKIPYVLFNSKMTGLCRCTALRKFPDAAYFLEDKEQAGFNADDRAVLRSAL